jgi:hypothetical protein
MKAKEKQAVIITHSAYRRNRKGFSRNLRERRVFIRAIAATVPLLLLQTPAIHHLTFVVTPSAKAIQLREHPVTD